MEQGNNIECLKTFRIKIPMYDQDSISEVGHKYFFPDNPIFKGKNIVGIDANLREIAPFGPAIQQGDLVDDDINFGSNVTFNGAKLIYCTIYGQDLMEKFCNVPLRSFYMIPAVSLITLKKNPRRVKPYYGEIYPRKSFLYIPINSVFNATTKFYVSLTFYYK